MRRVTCILSFAFFTLCSLASPPRQRTPIMGWSSWNSFRINIDEKLIREQADAMASNGMKEVGYAFVNIDDGYFGGRTEDGTLIENPEKFPNGMKALADYIHSKGLKAGIYTDAGKDTCGSRYDNDLKGLGAGLYQHENQDLTLMLTDWGYDFIKIDWCGGEWLKMNDKQRYTELGQIVRKVRPDVIYNICRWKFPGEWCVDVADSWRISGDIRDDFRSICSIIDKCEPLWKYAGPGHVNDMDMLQVGRGMTEQEDKTHFAMWCMMASPLLAGNDLRTMEPETLRILTNKDLIAINQDPLVYQARRLVDFGDQEIWARPLVNLHSGHVALALLNRANEPREMSAEISDVGIDASKGYVLRDCMEQTTVGEGVREPTISRSVPAHGVYVFRIKGAAKGREEIFSVH